MPKSKHRKGHKAKLNTYKANKKKEEELKKKKMMDELMAMQEQAMSDKQEHTSTEVADGPEIDLDELNAVPEFDIDPEIDVLEDIDIEDSVIEKEEK